MTGAQLERRFREAVQQFWDTRHSQQQKQAAKGTADAGTRGAVTGGAQMSAIEDLVVDLLVEVGLNRIEVHTSKALELPGYYRPEKRWDLLVVCRSALVCALEFKSHVGPSFGNNFNNRVEEALGSATDLWTAFRQKLLGTGPRPFLGYFILLEDTGKVHQPVKPEEAYFPIDPVFKDASYAKRYEILCQRLQLERLYDATCLTLSTNATPTGVSFPSEDVSFKRFISELQGNAFRFVQNQRP